MLLSVQEVTKNFPLQKSFWGKPTAYVRAVSGITLEVAEGEILGIVGESGCGKSTLGKCLVGLQEPSSGKVAWEGKNVFDLAKGELRKIRRFYQMVFQNPFASLDPRQKVRDLLLEPMGVHGILAPKDRDAHIGFLLERVGLAAADLRKYPHEFSGGQRQRIVLARALVCQPRLIVLDEPLSSLDVSVQASILNLLVELNRDLKISYVFISHDLQVVGYLSHRVLVMYLGKVVEEGETRKVLGGPRHPYTAVLAKASEGLESKMEGEPPNPAQIPAGCAFHPRCPHVERRCREETQRLQEVEKGWKVACWKWDQLSPGKSPGNRPLKGLRLGI